VFSFSGGHIMTSRRSITSIDALKGLKLATSAGIGDHVVKALGAVSVPVSGGQVFEVVSRGVVDGTALPDYALKAWRIDRHLKHHTQFGGGLYSYVYAVIMNQQKWDSLTADEKAALEAASGELIARDAKEYDEQDAAAIKQLVDSGVEQIQASDAMMAQTRKRLAFLEEDWKKQAEARGIDGAAALAFYRSEAKALTGK
jgi:TRAP-type transport system periplasmic protein